jgi:hypothetical protein
MGTYMNVKLKGTSENHIKHCNEEIRALGFKSEVYEGIPYGPFVTREQLIEDARFMNEDPEGLKQCPHFKRPITWNFLEENFIWFRLGFFQCKLSGGTEEEELKQCLIVAKWISKNKNLIDLSKSSNYTSNFIKTYLP